jgi:hypothetical protein
VHGSRLAVAHGGREPLQHVLENQIVSAETHAKVNQIQTRRAAQAVNQSLLDSLLDLIDIILGLKQAEDGDGNRVRV